MNRHFLTVYDLDGNSLLGILDHAQILEAAFRANAMPKLLDGMRIALSFEDGGFRNRVAFELGIKLMGGEAVYVPGRLGEKEPTQDIARYISNWFDALVVRTPEFGAIEQLAQAAAIPVINARTQYNHPCEILGDLAFARKLRGSLDGMKVVFVGEPTNLCHSWMEAAVCMAIDVVQVCPRGYAVEAETLAKMKQRAVGSLRVSHALGEELEQADVVYTDCWPKRDSPQAAKAIESAFTPYRVTSDLLDQTPPDCIFLPCPPVTRGEEISHDAMESSKCRVYEAKDYLLHAQNALLASLL